MDDLLSQAEIDALLSGGSFNESSSGGGDMELNPQEIDALGEIGNISMGTASTTLFTLLGQKVLITTPTVEVTTWRELTKNTSGSFIAVKAEFIQGLTGTNLLLLKEEDVKIITDLMMGGDGSNTGGDITDLHLSAISEAMNQMVGSAATSMASMINKRIDISPPKSFRTNLAENDFVDFNSSEKVVKISFKMEIGSLINSHIMQLLPIDFAKEMVTGLLNIEGEAGSSASSISPSDNNSEQNYGYLDNMGQSAAANQQTAQQMYREQEPYNAPTQQISNMTIPQTQPMGGYVQQSQQQSYQQQAPMHNPVHMTSNSSPQAPVNIQPIQFQSFDEGRNSAQKENINLLMEVPLQITVELGRTQKLIREILEFAPGSIIELDKLAGDLVDILVNGKIIAKGEVVIIDESFGVRLTDIVQPSKRL